MKKTFNINLGGFVYNIDEDAFEILESYIGELKEKLGSSPEAIETLHDIEERAAELANEKLAGSEIITRTMVEQIIAQLGNPNEIAGISTDSTKSNQDKANQGTTQRRLYRSSENSIIAGVCSGLGEYLAVDPIVIRILLVALLLAKGLGLLIYLLLWVVTPCAITPKQKLEMRGEPVNLENLGNKIREEMNNVKKNMESSGTKSFFEKLVAVFGKIAYAFLKILLVLLRVVSIVIGVVLISTMLFVFIMLISILFFKGMGLALLVPEISGFSLHEFFSSMFEIPTGSWVTIPIFLVVAIPVLALIYAGIRILFRFKARDGIIGGVAAIIWILAVIVLSITVFTQGRSLTIRESYQVTQTLDTFSNQNKTIYLEVDTSSFIHSYNSDIYGYNYNFFDYSVVSVDGERRIVGNPSLVIVRSNEEMPSLRLVKNARGVSHSVAEQNAEDIIYNYNVKDSVLSISPKFVLPNGSKWKGQSVVVKLYLPVGYEVNIDSSVVDLMETEQPYSNYWPDEMVNKTWRMTPNGLRQVK